MKTAVQVKQPVPVPAPSQSLKRQILQRKCACDGSGGDCEECSKKRPLLQRRAADRSGPSTVPPIVHDVLRSPGRPLDPTPRAHMEQRLGHDFSRVRVHTDRRAAESATAVNALAYTVGRDVVFAAGRYAPGTADGAHLIAHELVHVTQQNEALSSNGLEVCPEDSPPEHEAELVASHIDRWKGSPPRVHVPPTLMAYRAKGSPNFQACDAGSLVEGPFRWKKDKDSLPWIAKIDVTFDGTATDSDKDLVPTGKLKATYFANSAALPAIQKDIVGGKASEGLTDKSDKTGHTVRRIEGCGYHHTSVPKADRLTGHKRGFKYFKPTARAQATMNYAVFFVEGKSSGNQAIHQGSLSSGSLACVHVGEEDAIRQINYHSVEGHTRVHVSYDAASLAKVCCERFKTKGFMVANPCQGQKAKKCP